MPIAIIGAGEVGFLLSKELINQGYDLVVIEKDEKRYERAFNELDALVIKGNGARPQMLEEAGINGESTEHLIAVTNSDETNILACWLAKHAGVKRTIARARSVEFTDTSNWASELGIGHFVSPERSVSRDIFELMMVQGSIQTLELADGSLTLHAFPMSEHSPLANKALREIGEKYPNTKALVVTIKRGKNKIIPSGADKLLPGDIIFVVVHKDTVETAQFLFCGKQEKPTRRVLILGGGKVGFRVAKRLEMASNRLDIKLFEIDKDKCHKLSEELEHSLLINGDGTESSLLLQEGIEDCDGYISTSNNDEINLIAASLAKRLGARKTVALVRKTSYMYLEGALPVDIIVNSRMALVNNIITSIKFPEESGRFGILDHIKANMLELMVTPKSQSLGKTLQELGLPYGIIVSTIIRGDKIIMPRGNDVIQPGDKVIVFTTNELMEYSTNFFATK